MFYFGPVKSLTLGVDVRPGQGHYWHIYLSRAAPVTAQEECCALSPSKCLFIVLQMEKDR